MTQRPVRHHWFCLLAFGVMLLGASAVLADDGALARADALYEASRFKEAIPLYEQAVPTLEGEAKVEAQQRLAYSLLRAYKRDPDPIEAYKKLLQMPEADAERRANACYQIGYLHSLQADYETALEWYYKVPEIDGASPDTVAVAWLFAGTAYRKLDDYDRALEVLHKATEVTEAHWVRRQTAWVNIGSQHQEFEQYDQAVEAFREAVKLGPNHHYAHVARNRILECEAAQSGSDAFYLDPYVTHISATTAHVCWVSRHDAPAGTVQVTPEDGETITVDTERTDFRDHKSAFRQRAQLTGLTPGTRYTYVVTCGDESEAGAFTTAPDDQRVVRFGVLGDT
ncbi:MAG: fibronectin type III domain-containing protein [Phycisphaeraceae bacterium]